jgi:hypothetical protein
MNKLGCDLARYWTPEQRARQSAMLRQWQPWKQFTGARTPEGKVASSRNAYKGGLRSLLREMSALLREQRDGLKEIAWIIWSIDCWAVRA